ncbi:MAG: TIM barrel protein [Haloarculaceae archaeon]
MFDIHATKWATYPEASAAEFVEAVAAAGADGVGYLGWRDADVEELVAACDEHGIDWTSTGAGGAAGNGGDADAPSVTDPDCHDDAVAAIEETCEAVGEHVDRTIITVGPDRQGLERATQTNAIVSVLRAAAPAAAAADVTLVVEPLNTRVDHPGYFLETVDHGVEVVESVDHPNVRLLFDVYHQQVTEGDLVSRIDTFGEYVGMYHVADVPGRHELGTGEVNWATVFGAIADTGYEGSVGLEYVPSEGAETGETVAHAVSLRDDRY